MKPLFLILAILFQFPSNPRIETRHDRFSDTTSLVLTQRINALSGVVDLGGGSYYVPPGVSPQDNVYLHVIAVARGKTVTRDAKVTLALTSRSADWIFLKQTNTLRMIVNGSERLDFGIMVRTNSDVFNGGVMEQLAAPIALSTVERLAKASKIEVQVSNDEFGFSKDQISDLKDFVSRFPPAPK